MRVPELDPRANDLAAIAHAYGVATSFIDQSGVHTEVADETVIKVLAALDVDVEDPNALERAQDRFWREPVPPVVIVTRGHVGRIPVHVPHGTGISGVLKTEGGDAIELVTMDWWVDPREIDGVLTGEASLAVPDTAPLGWHSARVTTVDGTFDTTVVIVPNALEADHTRRWGLMAQLYASRSSTSSGIGDLHDLAALGTWGGRQGADFILINPLHASQPTAPMEQSPYLPATRRFVNPIYLRVQDIVEFSALEPHVKNTVERSLKNLQRLNVSAELLERDLVWTAKRLALELVFDAGMSTTRTHEFDSYVAAEGDGLENFATWAAIVDAYGQRPSEWPEGLRSVHGSDVAAFRGQASRDITFHKWLQWQLDQQLEVAQLAAKTAGMSIGVMQDLAVGVHPDGADAWALGDVLAHGVSVGAPPDMYNQRGQDWSQPPWRPDALRAAAYVPYRDMLRTILRHAGALRIDHILGLFRLWWIPNGSPASAGTYVSFDEHAMLGILMLEVQRANAIVVGEDLGTVPDVVEHALAERGILGTIISWFEHWDGGGLKPPEHWRENALASIWVHDLPPTMGYLEAEHVRLRDELNLLTTDAATEYAVARAEKQDWVNICVHAGVLDREDAKRNAALMVGLYQCCAASPARLFGVGLNDLVGDVRAQNQPGTHREYPNWSVPMCDHDGKPVLIEELETSPLAHAIISAVKSVR